MAWRFKIIVLYITLFVIGILLVEELITYTVKLPKYGYQKYSETPEIGDRKISYPHTDPKIFGRHKTTVELSQINEENNLPSTAPSFEIHQNTYMKPLFMKSKKESQSETTTAHSTEEIEREHAQRIENLHKTCESEAEQRRYEQRKANLTRFYYNKEHDFAYCKVPKSGSTFWMKVFMIMVKGKNYTNAISQMSRREIHDRTGHMVINPMHILRHNTPTVVVSRNPFSRLYSAYIDKVYLPLFWETFANMPSADVQTPYFANITIEVLKSSGRPLSSHLMKYRDQMNAKGMLVRKRVRRFIQPICVNNASFEDFLKFIIAEVEAGHALEPHWAPISHLCHPCRFNIHKIVKQESFSSDVEHTLNSIGIDLDEYDWLKSSLHENRVRNSVPGIVSVLDFKLKLRQIKKCISPSESISRLWKAFQIQGFVSKESNVPAHLINADAFVNKDVTDAVLDAVAQYPLAQSESRKQRQDYLIDAYRGISEETLTAIQQIYYLDFVLFGYSFNPP